MQSSLKKSLYLGLAAVSFAAVAGATTANASAAAKVTSTPALTAAASDRNVTFTGANAMYTKPGTVSGAKVVASTTTLNKLKDSKQGQDNVRVYAQAVTDRGSVYYKVVTYDKAYRGWVYGGKVQQQFNGGIASYNTTKDTTTTLTSDFTSKYYTIAKPGTANDGTATTYVEPAWTQYKVGRTVTDGTKIGNDLLKVSKQATRTREGDTWVYVTDQTNSQYSGWILKSALKVSSDVPASEGVTVNYIQQSTGKTVGTKVVPFVADAATQDFSAPTMNLVTNTSAYKTVKDSVPAGYSPVNANTDSFGGSNATAATKGSTVVFYVKANDKVNTPMNVYYVNKSGATVNAADILTQAQHDALGKVVADLNGVEGLPLSGNDIKAAFEKEGLTQVKDAQGNTYNLDRATDTVYGTASSVYFK